MCRKFRASTQIFLIPLGTWNTKIKGHASEFCACKLCMDPRVRARPTSFTPQCLSQLISVDVSQTVLFQLWVLTVCIPSLDTHCVVIDH